MRRLLAAGLAVVMLAGASPAEARRRWDIPDRRVIERVPRATCWHIRGRDVCVRPTPRLPRT